MTVHTQSVIEPWVKDFYLDFYNALTDMENTCYNGPILDFSIEPGSTSSLDFFKPEFTKLQTAMNAWAKSNWQPYVADIAILGMSLLTTGQLYGADTSAQVAKMDARKLFTMGGFIDSIISKPNTYYTTVDLATATCPNMATDLTTIGGAFAVDSAAIQALKPAIYLTLKTISAKGTFEPPTGSAPTAAEKTKKFFTDMHYKQVYKNLSVGGSVAVTLPSGI